MQRDVLHDIYIERVSGSLDTCDRNSLRTARQGEVDTSLV